jgi:hypothetical protein
MTEPESSSEWKVKIALLLPLIAPIRCRRGTNQQMIPQITDCDADHAVDEVEQVDRYARQREGEAAAGSEKAVERKVQGGNDGEQKQGGDGVRVPSEQAGSRGTPGGETHEGAGAAECGGQAREQRVSDRSGEEYRSGDRRSVEREGRGRRTPQSACGGGAPVAMPDGFDPEPGEERVQKSQPSREGRGAGSQKRDPDGRHAQTGEHRRGTLGDSQIQVVRKRAAAEQQFGPGECAIEKVSPNQAGEGPLLTVLHLNSGIENHGAPRLRQARAEFDIFDAGVGVGLIEAAGRKEHITFYGAAAGPESECAMPAAMVDEAVLEVFVLRKEPRVKRRIVVGADDGVEPRIGREGLGDTAQGVRMHADVGIEEAEDGTGGVPRAEISRPRGTAASTTGQDLRAKSAGDSGAVVSRPVIDYDAFIGHAPGFRETFETGAQIGPPVPNRDYDRQLHVTSSY